MINILFGLMIIIGIVYSFLSGNTNNIGLEIINSSTSTIEICIRIFSVMALWLGIMKIAEKSGLLKKLSNIIMPILKIIFPSIPKNHESFDYISSNIIANMFGLGNAATPFGIKAMKSLSSLSPKGEASDAMITFLIINTTGLTLIPTTVISLRIASKSINPSSIIFMSFLSSFLALICGLIINYIMRMCHK